MAMSVTNDDNISSHIIKIGTVGARLRKLCRNGMISIKDIQTASLISSLPKLFSSVTSPFEQREDAKFDDVCMAVKGHVVTRKNQLHQTTETSSTAHVFKDDNFNSKSDAVSSTKNKGKGKKKSTIKPLSSTPGPCTHCKGKYHDISSCLQKKNEELNTKLDSIIEQISSAKTNLARESDYNSDFSESMARSAKATIEASTNLAKRINVDSGTSNTLVPPNSHL